MHQYAALCVIVVIAYAVLHYLFFYPSERLKRSETFQSVNSHSEQCVVKCDAVGCRPCDLSVRGRSYIVDGSEETNKKISECFITFWGVTHFMLYAVIGFFCPDLFWQTLAMGIGWELYEYEVFDCHDTLDIFLNTAGFLVGRAIKRRS